MKKDFLNRLIEIAKPRAHNLDELYCQLEVLLTHLHSLFSGHRVGLYLLDHHKTSILRAAYLDDNQFNTEDTVVLEQQQYPQLFELLVTNQDFFIQDIEEFELLCEGLAELGDRDEQPKSFMAIPFRIQGSLAGWFTVSNLNTTSDWSAEQIQLCKLFANIASRGVLETQFPELLNQVVASRATVSRAS